MATSIIFNAVFKFPVGNTTVAWATLATSQDGSTQLINYYSLSQDMTNSGVRTTNLGLIVAAINTRYTATEVSSSESWELVSGNYEWTVAIECTTDEDVLAIGTMAFFVSIFLFGGTLGEEFLLFPVSFEFGSTTTPTITECDVCYEIQKQSCQSTYTFQLDLTPATTYTVAFYANNGNIYTQEVEAGGDGELVVDATAPEFPEGFFIPESGGYVVKVFTDTDLATVVPFVIGSNQYQCIQLSFAYVTTTTSSVQATFEYLIHDDDTDTDYFIIDDIGNNFIV